MRRLSLKQRAEVLSLLCEGVSVAGIERHTGITKRAILSLVVRGGKACRTFHDRAVRGLKVGRCEVDEMHSTVRIKAKRATVEDVAKGYGDSWLWIAMAAEEKLIISYRVGQRDGAMAEALMTDLASRLACRVQLTTDGFKPYVEAVESAFGCEVDFAQLVKAFSTGDETETRRIGIIGSPDPEFISTSYSERLNLSVRTHDRRFTRRTTAISKKVENHVASVDLHVAFYNWCRYHMTLRCTPAMQCGLANHVWSFEELAALIDSEEQRAKDEALRKLLALVRP